MTYRRLWGAVLILLGVVLLVSLATHSSADWPRSSSLEVKNAGGRFGAYVSDMAFFFFGISAWLCPVVVFASGWRLVKGVPVPENSGWQTSVSIVLIFAFTSGTLRQIWPESGGPGGTFGHWLNDRLGYVFGSSSILIFLFFGILGVIGLLPPPVLARVQESMKLFPAKFKSAFMGWMQSRRSAKPYRPDPIPVQVATLPPVRAKESAPVISPMPVSPISAPPAAGDSAEAKVPITQKTIAFPGSGTVKPPAAEQDHSEPETPEEKEFQKGLAKYRLPPLELLKWPPEQEGAGIDQAQLQSAGQILEDTLKNFGIDAQVVQIVPGPTVTLYEVLPAAGVAVSKIAAREADLKLALAANSLRIVAPIPGKSVVGVEVPNPNPQIVKIRELLAFEKFTPGSFTLPFALGKDILGKPVIVDLQKMPHVLVAGATGSGKSVCVASLLVTLLYRLTPGQLRMILIDPKRVELSLFSEIPHLLCPPILDAKTAGFAFKWLLVEMDSRYNILSDSGSKNLESYNAEQARLGLAPLPYIVLVVDELADVMLSAEGRFVENAITRLAQMSRAVGIHLVLATQRPSVDVITGLIKANMPARIAFQVASQVDARTILDAKGAEALLGRGDMLYLSPNAQKPVRLQGAYVDEEELHRVVDFLRGQMKPLYVDLDSVPENLMMAVDANQSRAIADATDDISPQLYEDSKRFIVQIQKGSTSMLQRKFKIGFNRATKIIEMLEKDGIVGPNKGPTPRDVLVKGVPASSEEPHG